MFRVLDKLCLGNVYCVSVVGDIQLLKNGIKLIDEKKNIFEIETVAMSHYQNTEEYDKRAELVLCGDVENIGEVLYLNE